MAHDIADVGVPGARQGKVVIVSCFAMLCLAMGAFRAYAARTKRGVVVIDVSGGGGGGGRPERSASFVAFERMYLFVYLTVMASDWLQGPYVYELYRFYGFDQKAIAFLFVIGFGSSMVFGTFIGSIADKYGRKASCQLFCVLYALGCLVKHSGSLAWLLVGRLLGGISTSILFSSFESWMVKQHHSRGFPSDHLSMTFSKSTTGNGIVAIAAGIVANTAHDYFGPVGPFDVAAVLLTVALVVISSTWDENYGDASVDVNRAFRSAIGRIRNDGKILVLGTAQSLFEASMYVFVFLWTPALGETSAGPIEHGWIFACFMLCTMIGSQVFGHLVSLRVPVEDFLPQVFGVASIALAIPAVVPSFTLRLLSFFVFEVCCGLYWPGMGTLRGRYIPDDIRSTVMNLFRLPLNFIVVVTLLYLERMDKRAVWLMCACMQAAGAITQTRLKAFLYAKVPAGESSGAVDAD